MAAFSFLRVPVTFLVLVLCSSANAVPSTNSTLCKWSKWGPCSVSCGAGWRSRTRQCQHGTEEDDDEDANVEQQMCNTRPCGSIADNTTMPCEWGEWSACSALCDGGFRNRTKHCTTDEEDDDGDQTGHLSETQACNTGSCSLTPQSDVSPAPCSFEEKDLPPNMIYYDTPSGDRCSIKEVLEILPSYCAASGPNCGVITCTQVVPAEIYAKLDTLC